MGLCFAAAALVPILYIVVSLLVRPSIYSDSGFGFLVWDSMLRGAAFNHALSPDPADIAKDVSYFLTTWTPGQYLFPGILEKLGLSLGAAIIVVDGVFSVAGTIGWFALYRAFGFPLRTTAVALATMVCSRHFALPFGIYAGGEVLVFGGAPWFFLMIWRLRSLPWTSVPALVGGGLAMIFLKLNGVVLAASAVGAAVLAGGGLWPLKTETVRKAVVAGVAITLVGVIFYFGWFTRGWTAGAVTPEYYWSRVVSHTPYSLSALWSAALSINDLQEFVFLNPGRPLLKSNQAVGYFTLPLALGTFAFVWWRLRRTHADYLRFVFWLAAAYTFVLIVSWVRGGAVSLEGRHFRSISLVLLVGATEAFVATPLTWLRGLFYAALAALSLYGVTSFVTHVRTDLQHPLGVRGFRQHIASPEAVAFIRTIDVRAPDGTLPLIYVPSPEIGLEIRTARVLAGFADFEETEELTARHYHGRVSRLYVLIQKRLVDSGKADLVLRSFVDYPRDAWGMLPLGDFVCFIKTS